MNLMNELLTTIWKDYELIDSGGFEKLERYGSFILRRPEPQAVWPKKLASDRWESLPDAWFKRAKAVNQSDSNERGDWKTRSGMPDQWQLEYMCRQKRLVFRLGMTAFKHIGIFPEQASNWDFIYDRIKSSNVVKPNILNLFAYTGGATLAAAAAGANVTHVDSVKAVVNWASENAELSGLSGIRWIVDDALKFVQRETRRGRKYNGIILDPPAYGRGPNGEKWILQDQINALMESCSALLEPGGFVLLNLYSMGFSPVIAANLLSYYFGQPAENVEYGELAVKDKSGFVLPLSVFARF